MISPRGRRGGPPRLRLEGGELPDRRRREKGSPGPGKRRGDPGRPGKAGAGRDAGSAGTEHGFARGGPVPIEPALGNRAQPGRRSEVSRERAEGMAGTDPPEADWSHSECPARWHGPAPSLGEGCSASVGWLGTRPGRVGGERLTGFRGHLSPNGPPSPRLAPGGFYGKGAVGGTRRRRGIFATHERRSVSQVSSLYQNPPDSSMSPPTPAGIK